MPSRRIWARNDGVAPAVGRLEVDNDVHVPRMAVGDLSHGRVAVPVVNMADDDSDIEGTPDNGGSTTDEVEDWGSAVSEAGSHIAEEESTPDVFDADEARMTGSSGQRSRVWTMWIWRIFSNGGLA